jgi:hypothetical protein
MLFRQPFLDGLADGRITLAFRKWRRPSVKAGGTLHTAAGLLAIEEVVEVDDSALTPTAARHAGFASLDELLADLAAQREGTLYRIRFRRAGDDPRIALRERGDLDATEFETLQRKLARLDAASATGPWTLAVLRCIAAHPATRAADLNATLKLGFDLAAFKLNVRKLKNLGLTESLGTGYRISPRGQTVLERIG